MSTFVSLSAFIVSTLPNKGVLIEVTTSAHFSDISHAWLLDYVHHRRIWKAAIVWARNATLCPEFSWEHTIPKSIGRLAGHFSRRHFSDHCMDSTRLIAMLNNYANWINTHMTVLSHQCSKFLFHSHSLLARKPRHISIHRQQQQTHVSPLLSINILIRRKRSSNLSLFHFGLCCARPLRPPSNPWQYYVFGIFYQLHAPPRCE